MMVCTLLIAVFSCIFKSNHYLICFDLYLSLCFQDCNHVFHPFCDLIRMISIFSTAYVPWFCFIYMI